MLTKNYTQYNQCSMCHSVRWSLLLRLRTTLLFIFGNKRSMTCRKFSLFLILDKISITQRNKCNKFLLSNDVRHLSFAMQYDRNGSNFRINRVKESQSLSGRKVARKFYWTSVSNSSSSHEVRSSAKSPRERTRRCLEQTKFRANFKPFVSNPFAPLRYLDPRGHPAGSSRRERDRGSGCARSFLAWPCTKRRRGRERASVQPVRRVTPKSFSSRYDSLLYALDYMDHPVYRALKCSSKNLRSIQRGARPRSLAFLRARWCTVRGGLTHSTRVL